MTIRHFIRYQVPVGLWIITIFLLSSIPRIPEINMPFKPDKIVHVGIYFVLCLLWKRALSHQDCFEWLRRRAVWVALGLTVIQGVVDEVYQMYVPGRWSDVYDAIADAVGGLLFVLWFFWRGRRSKEARPI